MVAIPCRLGSEPLIELRSHATKERRTPAMIRMSASQFLLPRSFVGLIRGVVD